MNSRPRASNLIGLDAGIALLSGALFNYNDPASCDVAIGDIAAALSNVCRFAGHLPQFYSVAQHAVNASHIVSPDHAFSALMHDTAEAFTNDLPTPLKHALPVFKELEVKIETAMAARFGFQYPLSPEVKYADLQMLCIEKLMVKHDYSHWSILDGVIIDQAIRKVNLVPMAPPVAKTLFLARYEELRPRG